MIPMKEIIKKTIEVHNALCRVTDLLPLREPMRKMLREAANGLLTYIVGDCGESGQETKEFYIKIGAKIETIQNTLSAVKEVGYCHPVNFDVLQREYEEIGGYFRKMTQEANEQKSIDIQVLSAARAGETLNKKEDDFVRVFEDAVTPEEKKAESAAVFQASAVKPNNNGDSSSNDRQQTIIDFIKERKEVKSTDLATIFSNRFSLKTLQRDLVALIQNKVIEKDGEKRWAVYRMNGYH